METKDLGPKKGETAEQFKARISETERELKREAAAKAPVNATVPDAPATPAQVSPTVPEVKTPDPAVTPKGVVTGNQEVDEWLGKKGFKTTEDMANSLRELERELHRRAQEKKQEPAPAAPSAPPVGYPPYYPPMAPQAPGYAFPPVPPPYAPAPVDINQLAQRYGMTPEDFERVAAIANDMAESKVDLRLKAVLPRIENQVRNVDREVSKQKELVNLMSDPAFKNPQVQYEMHRVLEEDPAVFDKFSQPYRYAYDQALMRIARANLGGSRSTFGAPEPIPVATPSGRPPVTAGGNGGGGGGAPQQVPPESVTPELYAKMSLADKKAHLQAIGAF